MEYYQGRICVSFEDLTGGDDPIVRHNTLKSWLRRKTAIYARKAHGEGVRALIEYDTLPTKAKAKIVARYGDPHETLQPKGELAWLAEDLSARRYFRYEYRYELGGAMVRLPDYLADEYELNARVLNALIERQGTLVQMSNKLNNKRKNIWDLILQYCEELRQDYAHTLPRSKGRLQKKVGEYKKQGYPCLISGNVGNSNTRKVSAEVGEYLIGLMRSREYVHSFETALLKFNSVAPEKGWACISSVSTVRDFLSDPAIEPLWLSVQQGESVANTKYGAQFVSLTKPQHSNALWAADGTKLNIYYLNEEGKKVTTDIYMIFDVCTGYCVGWSLGQESAYGTQYPAFRMAVERAGVKPFQLVMDNQSSQRKLDRVGFFSRLSVVGVRFKTPYRKQANPAEALIGQFQKSVLSHSPYFTGYNITARGKLSGSNEEWIGANLEHLPTHDTLRDRVAEWIAEWNRQVPTGEKSTRQQLYDVECANPEHPALTEEDMLELFYERRERMSTFAQGGLTIEIGKKEYHYDAYTEDGKVDFAWRKDNTLRRFGVKYDPLDHTKIAIYRVSGDDSWRFERYLFPAVKIAMAAEDRTAHDDVATTAFLEGDRQMRIERNAQGMAIDIKMAQHEAYNYPRLLGASKADNEAVVERAKVIACEVQSSEISVKGSKVSLAQIKKEESKMDRYSFAPLSDEEARGKMISKI